MKAWGLLVAVVLAGSAHAQSPGEISFWESVRDSKDPAELRAYLQQYPNGTFAAIAKRRIETLEQKPPPPVAATAPAVVAGEKRTPQAGDTWVYRLSYPRIRGQWGQPTRPPATHTITVNSVEARAIADQVSVDGGTPLQTTHAPGAALIAQGASILSPYLPALDNLPATGRLRSVTIRDCAANFACEAKGRVAGQETVSVPAGRFSATKVIIDEEWRATQLVSGAGRMTGGRTLTVWYSPAIGRAVKYSSRLTVGEIPPFEANFDLELVSYQLK
jgi:hypothetical protein